MTNVGERDEQHPAPSTRAWHVHPWPRKIPDRTAPGRSSRCRQFTRFGLRSHGSRLTAHGPHGLAARGGRGDRATHTLLGSAVLTEGMHSLCLCAASSALLAPWPDLGSALRHLVEGCGVLPRRCCSAISPSTCMDRKLVRHRPCLRSPPECRSWRVRQVEASTLISGKAST